VFIKLDAHLEKKTGEEDVPINRGRGQRDGRGEKNLRHAAAQEKKEYVVLASVPGEYQKRDPIV